MLFLLAGIGLCILIYRIVTVFLWIYLDCNIELFLKATFGKEISTLGGKVIWITGASSGIGRSLALLLASHGVKLAISARRLDELQKLKDECLHMSAGKLREKDILVLRMDLLEIAKHEEAFERVLKHFSRLDVLVNNAGRGQRASWLDIDLNVDKALFELNVFSPVHLTRIVVKYFLENKIEGQIAVNSSFAALVAAPNMSSYVGAKSAVNGYFQALKIEHPEIKNTLFCVGPTFTTIQEEAFTDRVSEKCGKPLKVTDKRLSSDRTAFLFAAAIANATDVSWAGLFPFTLLVYLRDYPQLLTIAMRLMNWTACKPELQGK
ncbi:dehydrogenase/reductase SDR family member 7-like [Phlebotomus argentipes]|uniref:dehydrogenase/reductase SDR family member 7-like n=1 Tax=Phlebotomus argentipes TaxID=94469 RepID=UPI002892F02C|nr:dehydrogenase/reductase SDR family member 7-like [Phlebotomus argentipes]